MLIRNKIENIYKSDAGNNTGDLRFAGKSGSPGSAIDDLLDYVTFKNNANIRIGTTTPTEKLEVNGKTKTTTLQMTSGAGENKILQSDASGNGSWTNQSTIAAANEPWYGTDNNNGATSNNEDIYQMGKVGIGTNSPITQLQVNGGATNKNGISVRGNADWDALTLAHDGSVAYINASGVENGIAIRTNDFTSGNAISNSYTEQVRILNNGNVGIGTNSPTTTLHVRSTTSPALRIVDGNQGNGKILTSDASGNATWQDNNLPMISAFQGMVIPICANVSTNSTGSFVTPINDYDIHITTLKTDQYTYYEHL